MVRYNGFQTDSLIRIVLRRCCIVGIVILFTGLPHTVLSQVDTAVIADTKNAELVVHDTLAEVKIEDTVTNDADSAATVSVEQTADSGISDTVLAHTSSPVSQSEKLRISEIWKFSTDTSYRAVKIHDVDVDGKNEVVLCTDNTINMYHFNDGNLQKIAEYKTRHGTRILSIDIADFNANGDVHLFVSAVNSNNSGCKSFVLAFKNGKFLVVQKNIQFLFKLVSLRNGIKELYCQKRPQGNRGFGEVHTMVFSDKKYVPKNRIKPLDDYSIFGLSYCQGLGPASSYYTVYKREGNLVLLNASTYKQEYESSERYGGYPEYLILDAGNDGDENRLHLVPPIWSSDFNNDGKSEIVVVKNHEMLNNIMAYFKVFNRSHLEIFSVENSVNVPSEWVSSKFTGYISGLDYGDFNNDGINELLVIRVIKSGDIMFQKPLVEITAYSVM